MTHYRIRTLMQPHAIEHTLFSVPVNYTITTGVYLNHDRFERQVVSLVEVTTDDRQLLTQVSSLINAEEVVALDVLTISLNGE